MKNKRMVMGLCPGNVNPNIHREFREVFYTKKGTLNGLYTKELIKALEWVMDVFEGKLEVNELVDDKSSLLFAHMTKSADPHIMRKNQRTDLTRLSMNNVDIEVSNRVKHFLIDNHGTKYGNLSSLMNQAMELYYKVENGFVELVKTHKKSDKSFLYDNSGEFRSIDTNWIWEALEAINLKVDNIKEDIKIVVKDTVQSTLNISSKGFSKTRKVIKGSFKSARHVDKFKKAFRVLENVMKWNEHGFTVKEYHRSLVKLAGQGDPRTASSDLAMLEGVNRIKKVRSNAHGTNTYLFVDNDQYHKFNTDLAKTKFLSDFKTCFSGVDAFSLDEFNELIFNKYGLFDARSQNRYLKWIIADGYVKRHPVNPRLFFIK